MTIPRRLAAQQGRYALVDGIPFALPVNADDSPALFAVFPINADKARALLPGNEVHPFRLWNKGLLVVTVIDYRATDIGKYIEFSIAIACTHGSRPAPALLPALFMKHYGTGQCELYDIAHDPQQLASLRDADVSECARNTAQLARSQGLALRALEK